jgi:hypothetical protein
MAAFKDRRAFERVGSSTPIVLIMDREPHTKFEATAKNISTGSICFETEAPLQLDDRVTLQLKTIVGPVSVLAVILRKQKNVYGCRYVDVHPDTAAKIRSWLFPPFEP